MNSEQFGRREKMRPLTALLAAGALAVSACSADNQTQPPRISTPEAPTTTPHPTIEPIPRTNTGVPIADCSDNIVNPAIAYEQENREQLQDQLSALGRLYSGNDFSLRRDGVDIARLYRTILDDPILSQQLYAARNELKDGQTYSVDSLQATPYREPTICDDSIGLITEEDDEIHAFTALVLTEEIKQLVTDHGRDRLGDFAQPMIDSLNETSHYIQDYWHQQYPDLRQRVEDTLNQTKNADR